jgi:hypothetical protein
MRDGVRIALDLYLPADLAPGERVPAILHQTQYLRSVELRAPFRLLAGGRPFDHTGGLYARPRRRFLEAGYAWLDVDVRGSGASFGRRPCPWSPDEIRDGGELVAWIVAQPWSNGAVGALGVSYNGTAAELLLANRHPAVKAVAPLYSLFDIYTDVAFPGGIRASRFLRRWGELNAALERNEPYRVAGAWTRLFITGVSPVDEDRDHRLRSRAVAEHAQNYDVAAEAAALTFRDDRSANDWRDRPGAESTAPIAPNGASVAPVGSIDVFSPHTYLREIAASGAAIYSYSGWYDGAYGHSAIKRHLAVPTPGSRLILGPWNHGGSWNISDPTRRRHTAFDQETELLRFFDHHLKGIATGIEDEPPVRYFTIGAGWRSGATWPPATRPHALHLAPGLRLLRDTPATEHTDVCAVRADAGTGATSRWRTQAEIDRPVLYPDWQTTRGLHLAYLGPPLARPLELAGHPLVTLFVSCAAEDTQVFAYLEDHDESGRARYVSEGMLRALHRRVSADAAPYPHVVPYRSFRRADALPLVPHEVAELTFDLLPIAYRFEAGHRIGLALAGADCDHFEPVSGGPPSFTVHHGPMWPSRLVLPMVEQP